MLYLLDRAAGTLRCFGTDGPQVSTIAALVAATAADRRLALTHALVSDEDTTLRLRWVGYELGVELLATTLGDTRVLTVHCDPAELRFVVAAALDAARTLAEATERLHREAGHALRTPLQLLQGQLLLAEPSGPGDGDSSLASLQHSVDRLAAAVTEVVDGDPIGPCVELAGPLHAAASGLAAELAARHVLLEVVVSAPCWSPLPEQALVTLLGVLVAYGVHRADLVGVDAGSGPVRLGARVTWDAGGDLALELTLVTPATSAPQARPGELPAPVGEYGRLLAAVVAAARGQLRWRREATAERTTVLLPAPGPTTP